MRLKAPEDSPKIAPSSDSSLVGLEDKLKMIEVLENGSRFVGERRDSLLHGAGNMVYVDGSTFEGFSNVL